MRAAGYDLKVLAEEFGSGTPDPEWLPIAAMARLLATQPAPFIGRILLSGYVGLIYPRET